MKTTKQKAALQAVNGFSAICVVCTRTWSSLWCSESAYGLHPGKEETALTLLFCSFV